ncbi:uncharacterized protein ISCGN_000450 [Ixodes scapularis]
MSAHECWDNGKPKWKKTDSEKNRGIHATGGGTGITPAEQWARPSILWGHWCPTWQCGCQARTTVAAPALVGRCSQCCQPPFPKPQWTSMTTGMMPDSPASPLLDWGGIMEVAVAASPTKPQLLYLLSRHV